MSGSWGCPRITSGGPGPYLKVGPIPYIARWELFRVRPTKTIPLLSSASIAPLTCYLLHIHRPSGRKFNLLNHIPVCIGFAFWSVLGLRIRCEDGSGSGGSGSLPGIEDGHRCVRQPCSGQGCGRKSYPTLRILQFRYYLPKFAVRVKLFCCLG